MLARDNVLVGDDPGKVTFERDGVYTDQETGKPVAAITRYSYDDGQDRYVVSFTRTRDLSAARMADAIKGALVSWPRPIRTTRSGNSCTSATPVASSQRRTQSGRAASPGSRTATSPSAWALIQLGSRGSRPVSRRTSGAFT
jgi:hypothetical protein